MPNKRIQKKQNKTLEKAGFNTKALGSQPVATPMPMPIVNAMTSINQLDRDLEVITIGLRDAEIDRLNIKDRLEEIKTNINENNLLIKQLGTKPKGGILPSLGTPKDKDKGGGFGLLAAIGAMLGTMWDSVKGFLANPMWDATKRFLANPLKFIGKGMWWFTKETAKKFWNVVIKDSFVWVKEFLKDTLDDMIRIGGTWFKNMSKIMGGIISNIWTKTIRPGIGLLIAPLKSSLSNMWAMTIKPGINLLLEPLKMTISNIWTSSIKPGISLMFDPIKKTFSSLITGLQKVVSFIPGTSAISNIFSSAMNAAKNIGGIVVEKARVVGSKVVSVAQNLSPFKLFERAMKGGGIKKLIGGGVAMARKLGHVLKGLPGIGLAIEAAISGHHIASVWDDNKKSPRQKAIEVIPTIGGSIGSLLGTALGSFGGPLGALVAGVGGNIAGQWLAKNYASDIADVLGWAFPEFTEEGSAQVMAERKSISAIPKKIQGTLSQPLGSSRVASTFNVRGVQRLRQQAEYNNENASTGQMENQIRANESGQQITVNPIVIDSNTSPTTEISSKPRNLNMSTTDDSYAVSSMTMQHLAPE